MKKTLAASFSTFAALLAVGCSGGGQAVNAREASDAAQRVERGRYMVGVMGCTDCHTPMKMGANGPEHDMERYLSGHPEQVGALPPAQPQGPWIGAVAPTNTAFSGPWGVSYSANITPDQNTGLGIWTEEMFIKAIRTGRHMGTSREILPPMPWPAFRNATDEDLKAVWAYLRSVKPIVNHVPEVQPVEPIF